MRIRFPDRKNAILFRTCIYIYTELDACQFWISIFWLILACCLHTRNQIRRYQYILSGKRNHNSFYGNSSILALAWNKKILAQNYFILYVQLFQFYFYSIHEVWVGGEREFRSGHIPVYKHKYRFMCSHRTRMGGGTVAHICGKTLSFVSGARTSAVATLA